MSFSIHVDIRDSRSSLSLPFYADSGDDGIFFFNYSRINMKLDLAIMNRSVDEFFEPERAKALRDKIQNRSAFEREEIIMAAVKSSITEAGGIPLVFGFNSDNGRRSHYLVYASKDRKAAGMMKTVFDPPVQRSPKALDQVNMIHVQAKGRHRYSVVYMRLRTAYGQCLLVGKFASAPYWNRKHKYPIHRKQLSRRNPKTGGRGTGLGRSDGRKPDASI